jgi:hypothetical protein
MNEKSTLSTGIRVDFNRVGKIVLLHQAVSHVIEITSSRGTRITSGIANIIERKVCPIKHILETSGNIGTAILIGLYGKGVAVHTVCSLNKGIASLKY